MKIGIGYLDKIKEANDVIEARISFKPLIAFLEKSIHGEKGTRAKLFKKILNEFYKYPELTCGSTIENFHRYTGMLELIYTILTPLTADEQEHAWAISAPISKNVIFCTDAYIKLIESNGTVEQNPNAICEQHELIVKRLKRIAYNLILSKYYNLNPVDNEQIIYTYPDAATGLTRYYHLNPDTRFIEIKFKDAIPDVDPDLLSLYFKEGEVTGHLEESLPLANFYLEGFTVITLDDITEGYALENIKKALITHPQNDDLLYNRVFHGLKLLCGCCDIEFGMLPFFSLNDRLIFDDIGASRSVMLTTIRQSDKNMLSMYASAEEFLRDPGVRMYDAAALKEEFNGSHMNALAEAGIRSYSLVPVYYNRSPVGILEVYSLKDIQLINQILPKVNHAIPLIAQLLQNSIEQFETKIDNIIQDKFTRLQPAVRWKFNEAALNYYRHLRSEQDNVAIGVVTFQDVYPLYGMIDIRNSTIERNHALACDISNLTTLFRNEEATIYNLIKKETEMVAINELFFKWYSSINAILQSGDSGHLDLFLLTEVLPSLHILLNGYPETNDPIKKLIAVLEDNEMEVSGSRSKLEASMQKINSALNAFFSKENNNLARVFPCYFETFRTDGVEYDLYVGQSISPATEFSQKHIDSFRLWQLRSMAAAAALTKRVLDKDDWQLATTQLIYVNPHTINISFRNDERHFDVDGSYSIRYQVIKKRIDKVKIKNTGERLTQPGTIAIVYFNDTDIQIYLEYIKRLQDERLLAAHYEQIELEELQGIYGLRAIRVGVNF